MLIEGKQDHNKITIWFDS